MLNFSITHMAEELSRFGEVFNRSLSAATYLSYYKALLLGGITSDELFDRAALRVWQTARYFPAPRDFLYALFGDPQDRALREWTALLEAARKGAIPCLSPTAKQLVQAMGGMSRFYRASEYEMNYLRREFVSAYTQIAPYQLSARDTELLRGEL